MEYSYNMDIPHLAAFDPRHEGLLWNLWFVGGTLVQGLVYSCPSKRRSNGATVDVSVYLFLVVFVVRTQRTPCKDTALTKTTVSKVDTKTLLQHEKPDEYKELKVINTLRTNMPHMSMPA